MNSYVLQASNITKDTNDPPGGSFDRDPDGTPNGVIRESARSLLTRLNKAGGERVPFSAEVEGYLRCFRIYAQRGITSAGIAGGSPQSFRLYEAVRDAGSPVRMGFMYLENNAGALQAIGLEERLRRRPPPGHLHQSLSRELLERTHRVGSPKPIPTGPATSAFRPLALRTIWIKPSRSDARRRIPDRHALQWRSRD